MHHIEGPMNVQKVENRGFVTETGLVVILLYT